MSKDGRQSDGRQRPQRLVAVLFVVVEPALAIRRRVPLRKKENNQRTQRQRFLFEIVGKTKDRRPHRTNRIRSA